MHTNREHIAPSWSFSIAGCGLLYSPLLIGSDAKETKIFTAPAERSVSVVLEISACMFHGVRGKRE